MSVEQIHQTPVSALEHKTVDREMPKAFQNLFSKIEGGVAEWEKVVSEWIPKIDSICWEMSEWDIAKGCLFLEKCFSLNEVALLRIQQFNRQDL